MDKPSESAILQAQELVRKQVRAAAQELGGGATGQEPVCQLAGSQIAVVLAVLEGLLPTLTTIRTQLLGIALELRSQSSSYPQAYPQGYPQATARQRQAQSVEVDQAIQSIRNSLGHLYELPLADLPAGPAQPPTALGREAVWQLAQATHIKLALGVDALAGTTAAGPWLDLFGSLRRCALVLQSVAPAAVGVEAALLAVLALDQKAAAIAQAEAGPAGPALADLGWRGVRSATDLGTLVETALRA